MASLENEKIVQAETDRGGSLGVVGTPMAVPEPGILVLLGIG